MYDDNEIIHKTAHFISRSPSRDFGDKGASINNYVRHFVGGGGRAESHPNSRGGEGVVPVILRNFFLQAITSIYSVAMAKS